MTNGLARGFIRRMGSKGNKGSRSVACLVVYLTHQLLTDVSYAHSALKTRESAFEREAIPWIDDVHRFALSLTRDECDADDVVQDTFLRAYRSWHTYMP